MEETVITVDGLVKRYGPLEAVRGISFAVGKGEIFGLLGENGAGKTTTLEIIEGLRRPTAGQVKVLGLDVQRELSKIKAKIGVQLQSSAYYGYLSLREILTLFAGFYGHKPEPDRLLRIVNLEDKAGAYINQLSGGQQQRFSIVASLVNQPEVVFLDEPTTGLDPLARRNLWEVIAKIKAEGKTVILTTHYMEEAERLCDRIGIMDRGTLRAIDKTGRLIETAKYPYKLLFELEKLSKTQQAELAKLGNLQTQAGAKSGHYELQLTDKKKLDRSLDAVRDLRPESFSVQRASLEDVFIELTGKALEEESNV